MPASHDAGSSPAPMLVKSNVFMSIWFIQSMSSGKSIWKLSPPPVLPAPAPVAVLGRCSPAPGAPPGPGGPGGALAGGPGIPPPSELRTVDKWRIVGLTMEAEQLQRIRGQRVRTMGGFGTRDGYADLAKIYDELDEIGRIQASLGCPVVDTTGIALEESASRIIDIVARRALRSGTALRPPAGISSNSRKGAPPT